MSRKVCGIVKTLRPEIGIVSFAIAASIAVWASLVSSGSLPAPGRLFLACFATWLGTVAAYAINDYFDAALDRQGRPGRAIPSNELRPGEVLALGIVLGLATLAICLLVFNWRFALLGALASACILVYSAWFKPRTSYSFIWVVIATGVMPVAVWAAFAPLRIEPFLVAIVYLLFEPGFTLAGVARDIEGDRVRGVPTWPLRHGIIATARLTGGLWLLILPVSIMIISLTGLGAIFMIGALVAVGWLLLQAKGLLARPDSEMAGGVFVRSSLFFWVFNAAIVSDLLIGRGS